MGWPRSLYLFFASQTQSCSAQIPFFGLFLLTYVYCNSCPCDLRISNDYRIGMKSRTKTVFNENYIFTLSQFWTERYLAIAICFCLLYTVYYIVYTVLFGLETCSFALALDCERFTLWKEWMAISLFRSQKTSDSLKKPKTEFPTQSSNFSYRWTCQKYIYLFIFS